MLADVFGPQDTLALFLAQFNQQLAGDAFLTPARVLCGHPTNQGLYPYPVSYYLD